MQYLTHYISGEYRDPFPKMDLGDGFIGDKVPLCVNLPDKHFLKKGAQFRLLGSSPQPDLHNYGHEWYEWRDWFDGEWFGGPENGPLVLDSTSVLRSKLATMDMIVTLDSDISCTGDECDVDSLILVKVQNNPPIFYEYVRQPCVELSFYDNAKKITTNWDLSMCGNPLLDSAFDACCEDPFASYPMGAGEYCHYDFERMSQSRARSRCKNTFKNGDLCHFYWLSSTETCKTSSYNWYMVSFGW